MKLIELQSIITSIVHRYIEDGWILEINSHSLKNIDYVYFLSRGSEHIAVGICPKEKYETNKSEEFQELQCILFECCNHNMSFDFVLPKNTISERTFFKVSSDWYIEDKNEISVILSKRHYRKSLHNKPSHSFHPTNSFIDKYVRNRYGWENTKPTDILITKGICKPLVCYRIQNVSDDNKFFYISFLIRSLDKLPDYIID